MFHSFAVKLPEFDEIVEGMCPNSEGMDNEFIRASITFQG